MLRFVRRIELCVEECIQDIWLDRGLRGWGRRLCGFTGDLRIQSEWDSNFGPADRLQDRSIFKSFAVKRANSDH